MRSGAWAAGTLLLWIVFLPVYLIKRAPRTAAASRPAAASALSHEPPVAHAGDASTRRTVAIVAGVIVVLLYLSGRLDRELYKVGLNYHQCGQNGFGAVFCGDDLTAYNDHLQAVQQQATQAEDRPNKISAPQTRPPPAAPEPPRSFRPLSGPSATLGHDLGKHSGHALAGSYKRPRA